VSRSWAWLSFLGSVLWLAGSLLNALKVFLMHQSDALSLQKLRGGVQEQLDGDEVTRRRRWAPLLPITELR
jgi:hypothetical protein